MVAVIFRACVITARLGTRLGCRTRSNLPRSGHVTIASVSRLALDKTIHSI